MLGGTLVRIQSHRELIWEMAKRDLKGLNKGAVLGHLWLVISPIVQVAGYVVIVGFIFQRAPDPFEYMLYVLAGMVPWQILTRALQQAPMLIRERMELVKQVIYPIETIPLTTLIVSSIGALVAFGAYLILAAIAGRLEWSLLLLPIPLALLVMFILGTSWILSIAGIVVKDLREVVSVFLGLLVYVSPVVVSEEIAGPVMWKIILLVNPLSHVVISFRDVFSGTLHAGSWIVFIGMSVGTFLLGDWVIRRTKLLINEYI